MACRILYVRGHSVSIEYSSLFSFHIHYTFCYRCTAQYRVSLLILGEYIKTLAMGRKWPVANCRQGQRCLCGDWRVCRCAHWTSRCLCQARSPNGNVSCCLANNIFFSVVASWRRLMFHPHSSSHYSHSPLIRMQIFAFVISNKERKKKKRWMCVSLFAEVMTKSASNSPTYRMYGILFSRGFFFFQIPTTMMGHRLCVLKSMQKSQNYHTFPSRSNQI